MAANKEGSRRAARIVFAVYLAVLIYFLFFAEALGRTDQAAAFRYNLIPFHEIMRYIRYASHFAPWLLLVNLLGNIVAFMPFGFLLPQIANSRIGVLTTTVHAFFFSLTIEAVQLILQVGCFDVDDIILNTLGGMLGYLLYRLFRKEGVDRS